MLHIMQAIGDRVDLELLRQLRSKNSVLVLAFLAAGRSWVHVTWWASYAAPCMWPNVKFFFWCCDVRWCFGPSR